MSTQCYAAHDCPVSYLHFTLKNTISNLVPSDLAVGDSWYPASDCGRVSLIDDSVQRVDDGLRRLTTCRWTSPSSWHSKEKRGAQNAKWLEWRCKNSAFRLQRGRLIPEQQGALQGIELVDKAFRKPRWLLLYSHTMISVESKAGKFTWGGIEGRKPNLGNVALLIERLQHHQECSSSPCELEIYWLVSLAITTFPWFASRS